MYHASGRIKQMCNYVWAHYIYLVALYINISTFEILVKISQHIIYKVKTL